MHICFQMESGYSLFLSSELCQWKKTHRRVLKGRHGEKEILFLVLALLHKETWPLLWELKKIKIR